MNEELKLGDVVELRSGGPLMTIRGREKSEKSDDWQCVWECSSGERGEDIFPVAAFPAAALRNATNNPEPFQPLQVGDIVSLRSHGMKMTVRNVSKEEPKMWWCVFFKGSKLVGNHFYEHTLEKHKK